MAKKKNPVIEQARKQGYEAGYKVGIEHGKYIGVNEATSFIASKFSRLDKIPGIGPKTVEKFVQAFGTEYFMKVGEDDGTK